MSDESANRKNQPLTGAAKNAAPAETGGKRSLAAALTIALVLILAGLVIWIRLAPPQTVATAPNVPPAAKNSAREKEDSRDSDVNDALDDFLEANYKGWQKQGKSFNDAASDEDRIQIFSVHLKNADRNLVIIVFVEKFQRDDDSEYWYAYQPSDLQLLKSEIKPGEKKSAKETTGSASSESDEDDSN